MVSIDETVRKLVQLLQELWAVLPDNDLQLQLVLPAFPTVERLVLVGPVLEIVVVVPQGYRDG